MTIRKFLYLYCFLFAGMVLSMGSCKKSESDLVGDTPIINRPPFGYKFPALFKGGVNFIDISVYNNGKIEPFSNQNLAKYFPIIQNPMPEMGIDNNLPKETTNEIIELKNNRFTSLFPFGSSIPYQFSKGILKFNLFTFKYNDSTFLPFYYDFYQGDYYSFSNFKYLVNINGYRTSFFSLKPLSYKEIILYLKTNNGFVTNEFLKPKQKIAIATYQTTFYLQNKY